MKSKIDISIIIPTYANSDRNRNLCDLLNALRDQKRLDYSFEIIIVNNRKYSMEENGIIRRFKGYIKELRIVEDPVIGLSHARNTGILKSRGDIIAFLDDDVVPSNDWLNSLMEAHRKYDALCIGGPVIFKEERISFPNWFNDYYLRFLLPPKFPKYSCTIVEPFYLIGANISFKKDAFRRYGFFDESLGRKGRCLLSGEDTEFVMRLKIKDIFFASEAIVFSKVKLNRLSYGFFIKRIFWQAISEARIVKKHGIIKLNDRDELMISRTITKNLLRLLKEAKFFQSFCIMLRIMTFKLTLLLKL